MLHPVGGAMGVTCVTAVKRGYIRFDIISLTSVDARHFRASLSEQ